MEKEKNYPKIFEVLPGNYIAFINNEWRFSMEKNHELTSAIDHYLTINSLEFIDAVTVAKYLDEIKVLRDSPQRPGKNLRIHLRNGDIPHAYQINKRWFIPMSSNVSHRLNKREKMQSNFKPSNIKYLILAEAPPNNIDRYFYYEDVPNHDYLFLGIMNVLFPDIKSNFIKQKRNPELKKEMLHLFQENAFYLVDLSEEPKLKDDDLSGSLPNLIPRLKKMISSETKIIIIKTTVYDLTFKLLKENYIHTIDMRIPFPSSGNQQKFHEKFTEALKIAGYFE